jgi:hypothetical protein
MNPYIFNQNGYLLDHDSEALGQFRPYISFDAWRLEPDACHDILIPKQALPQDPQGLFLIREECKADAQAVFSGAALPYLACHTAPARGLPMSLRAHFGSFICEGGVYSNYTMPHAWLKPLSEADPETEVIPLYTQAACPGSEVVYTVLRVIDGGYLLLGSLLPVPHTKLVRQTEVGLSLPKLPEIGSRVRIDERLLPVLERNPSIVYLESGVSWLADARFEISGYTYPDGTAHLKSLDEGFSQLIPNRVPISYLIVVND